MVSCDLEAISASVTTLSVIIKIRSLLWMPCVLQRVKKDKLDTDITKKRNAASPRHFPFSAVTP